MKEIMFVLISMIIISVIPFSISGTLDVPPEVKFLALNNAQKEFIKNVYDCTQFSQALVDSLKLRGYHAECATGYVYEDASRTKGTRHDWVILYYKGQRIPIEATNGRIFDTEKDLKEYQSRYRSTFYLPICP